jgi:Ni/Fe-hydrogenase 1 B-type cytochrome subunit
MNDRMLRVYVWELPVRLTHWVNFLSVLTLSVTGYYIGRPFIHALSADQYIMGWMRFIHFTAAYVFIMSIAIRIYWAFVGNRYAHWEIFNPFSRKYWKNVGRAAKYYLFISRKRPYALGHQSLASLAYLLLLLLFIFEIISGFALYSLSHHGGVTWTILGGWLLNLMNLQTIRLLHHLVMYAVFGFVIVHVYITWFHGGKEENGLMGSMFNGFKFIIEEERTS